PSARGSVSPEPCDGREATVIWHAQAADGIVEIVSYDKYGGTNYAFRWHPGDVRRAAAETSDERSYYGYGASDYDLPLAKTNESKAERKLRELREQRADLAEQLRGTEMSLDMLNTSASELTAGYDAATEQALLRLDADYGSWPVQAGDVLEV